MRDAVLRELQIDLGGFDFHTVGERNVPPQGVRATTQALQLSW